MKKIFHIVFCLTLIVVSSFSANAASGSASGSGSSDAYAKVGMSGGQFLKIPHGARGSAMAGCVSTITDDLSSVFWNPAGIADIKSISAEFDYTDWFAGFSHNFASIGVPLGENFALAVHFTNLASEKMEYTTIEMPQGNNTYFTANDMSMGLTFAGYLTDQFSFGATVRYLNNSVSDMDAAGVSFDVGTRYKTGVQGITLGVSLHGLSSELTYSGRNLNTVMNLYPATWSSKHDVSVIPANFNIPLCFRAGVSADLYKYEEHYIIGAFDFSTFSDTPEQYALGAEYVWNDLLAARVGYRFGQDVFGFSAGIGIKYLTGYFSGRIDYSISPTSHLGLTNRLSIYIDLGR